MNTIRRKIATALLAMFGIVGCVIADSAISSDVVG